MLLPLLRGDETVSRVPRWVPEWNPSNPNPKDLVMRTAGYGSRATIDIVARVKHYGETSLLRFSATSCATDCGLRVMGHGCLLPPQLPAQPCEAGLVAPLDADIVRSPAYHRPYRSSRPLECPNGLLSRGSAVAAVTVVHGK